MAHRCAICLFLSLITGGCAFLLPDQIHYAYPGESTGNWCPTTEPVNRRMVGIALSGGGSRAAVFAAAGWEALAEHGLLSEVTHLSTVSAGSVAGAYIGLNPAPCTRPADEACRAYFRTFKAAMREDLSQLTRWRELNPGRTLSSTRRATSLRESLEAVFLGNRVFSEITARPVLLINASSYDHRRRFVFTRERLPVCPEQRTDGTSCPCGFQSPLLNNPGLRALTFPGGVPDDFPVSLAVTTSAAFPPVFGPLSFEVAMPGSGTPCRTAKLADRECEWWHLGDGGIIDNSGVDTLEEVALIQAERSALSSVLIIALDAGWLWEPGDMKRRSNLELWTEDPGRVVDAAKRRGAAYHELVWGELDGKLRNAAGGTVSFERIHLHYLDGEEEDLPASCEGEKQPGELADVPTTLSITACHADRIERAAHRIVHSRLRGRFEPPDGFSCVFDRHEPSAGI